MKFDSDKVLTEARAWLGTPWKEGGSAKGSSGGVDCSHLVNLAYKAAGYSYPYASTSQFPPSGYFKKVDESDAEEGDVVLFKEHMGILALDDSNSNNDLISAQGSAKKPGVVQHGEIKWFLSLQGYYRWAR